ncbi:hypothetical protein [Terrabacter sp. NPDC000476]|uniref:hypothetical protein n=1 Tax=Terrabacter sp. NPDC000476 TaxID=3154258 RepID=UPI00331901E8
MMLTQRQADIAVMFLSASGGAVVGVAASAWWWAVVGVAGLATAGWLLHVRSRQNAANAEMSALVSDVHLEGLLRRVVAQELERRGIKEENDADPDTS